jgi:hypothetical protein
MYIEHKGLHEQVTDGDKGGDDHYLRWQSG